MGDFTKFVVKVLVGAILAGAGGTLIKSGIDNARKLA